MNYIIKDLLWNLLWLILIYLAVAFIMWDIKWCLLIPKISFFGRLFILVGAIYIVFLINKVID